MIEKKLSTCKECNKKYFAIDEWLICKECIEKLYEKEEIVDIQTRGEIK